MTAISNTPTNLNYLSSLKFKVVFKRLPNIEYFTQLVEIPSLTLPPATQPTYLVDIPQPGDKLQYDDLNIQFIVDEDLNNYIEIHNWLRALGKPEFSEYRDLQANSIYSINRGLYSDISITMLTSKSNANKEFVFKDAWPTSISRMTFDTTSDTIQYVTCRATFKYTIFEINSI